MEGIVEFADAINSSQQIVAEKPKTKSPGKAVGLLFDDSLLDAENFSEKRIKYVSTTCVQCRRNRMEIFLGEEGNDTDEEEFTQNKAQVKFAANKRASVVPARAQKVFKKWTEKMLSSLFEEASLCGHIELPICLECTDAMSVKLEYSLREHLQEQSAYEQKLNNLTTELGIGSADTELALLNEEADLKKQEDLLLKQLQAIQTEHQQLQQVRQQVEEAEATLAQQEKQYWTERNTFKVALKTFEQDRDFVEQKIFFASKELDRLIVTNVFNDAFHIWYDGFFGTINNFRMGRLPSQNVESDEINAAWGHSALLLLSLARHKKFMFSKYDIIPMGGFTKLEQKNGSSYELYPSVAPSTALFGQSKYDNAMIAFLTNLAEFAKQGSKEDPTFELPYRIDGDKIGGLSIKSGSGDENWTKALKYMLTNLKFLIKWASK